eukprot:1846136-Prymnesium_polylepis.1
MGRKRDDDDDSVLTVDLLDPAPTETKSRSAPTRHVGANVEWTSSQDRQLANAREIALRNRRERLQTKLLGRLTELNAQLNVSAPQMEKIAHAMMRHEEELRTKMNSHLKDISTSINEVKASLHGVTGTARSEVSSVPSSSRRG